MRTNDNRLKSRICMALLTCLAVNAAIPAVHAAPPNQAVDPRQAQLTALSDQADALEAQGKTAQAIVVAQQLVALTEKVVGPEHVQVAAELTFLAGLHKQLAQYPQAKALYERALRIREKALPPDHPKLAISLDNLSMVLRLMGDAKAAKPLAERALAIFEKALGPDSVDVATCLNNLGGLLADNGEYAAARPLLERALAILEKAFGAEHLAVATALGGLGSLLTDTGEYATAKPLLERALRIREKVLGLDHRDVAVSLNNLALLLQAMGQYVAAKPLYERALRIDEKALGPMHPTVAAMLDNLAQLLLDMGQYAAAKPLFARALDIYEKAFGPVHPDLAIVLNNFAELLQQMGEYDAAAPMYERALHINEALYGQDHPQVAIILNNLAELFRTTGHYAAAITALERALKIQEKALGSDHPTLAITLNNLAHTYATMENYAAAAPLCERCLRIREKAFGSEHYEVAESLNMLGVLRQAMGDYAAARGFFQRALHIDEKALGPEHPRVVVVLDNWAQLEMSVGAAEAAWPLLGRAMAITRKHRDTLNAGALSEANKLALSRTEEAHRDFFLSTAVERARKDANARDVVLELVLDRKGLLLEAAMPTPNRKEPAAIAALRLELRAAAARLARAYTAAGTTSQQVIAELERHKEELQGELSLQSSSFRADLAAQRLDRMALCKALGPNRLAVEYVVYNHLTVGTKITREQRLLALVTDPTTCTLDVLELGKWQPVAENILQIRKIITSGRSRGSAPMADPDGVGDADAPSKAAKELYKSLIAPWVARVKVGRQVVLIPDDDLAFTPFAALVGADGKYLVETLDFSLLDSGREVARLNGRSAVRGGALILGGPDFDFSPNNAPPTAKAKRAGKSSPRTVQAPAPVAKIKWAALPGAAAEAETLGALLLHHDMIIGVLEGSDATEVRWKKLAPGQRYLHLATHGYFTRELDDNTIAALRNPLLQSGLVFAGANRPAQSDAVDDGWLTAEEVAGMDLDGTELVVLSACETGLGGGGSGEGVFGLRRAFFQAGARGLVMSLWNVDDAATVVLMQKFWTKMLGCEKTPGCTKARILAETQKEMLHDARWHDPQYWAAFVYIGEWER